jgi:DNA-binding SARP family transcriptional activator
LAQYELTTLAPVPRLTRKADGAECIRFSKQLAVLAYLMSRPQARATRDELVGLLWGEPSQADGRRALRQVVYQIRHATDHDLLRGDDVLTLRREDITADADLFRQRLSAGDFEGALCVYEQDFLANVALAGAREFEQWAEGVRAILAAERRQALRTLIARESDAGRWTAAARYGEHLLASDPGSLDARLRLVELLALSGDALRARAAAEETRVLAAETGGDTAVQAIEPRVLRALAPTSASDRRASSEFPRLPEMVGRATQFHSVVERWRSTLDGRGGAVLLTGEAGIGKTRLSSELTRRFGQDHALVLGASCYVLEQSEPLAPFLEMVRQGQAAPGLGGASAASLEILAALIPEVALRFRGAVEPRQLPILPQAVAAALLDAFGAIGREAALAMVVEDLHWASPATIEFTHRLARQAMDHALLLVLTARDHAATLETTHALRSLAASEAVEEVALDSLDEGDVAELLGSIAELTPDVAGCCLPEQLVRHTDGIPLYVVEVLKELHDTGYLVVRDGRWVRLDETNPGTAELPLPASGTDILRSRLRKLGPRLLHALTALAVWGREASVATLAEVAGLEPEQAEEAGLVLERRRLVVRREGMVSVAHEEIGSAAVELAPAELVTRLHARAAALAADLAGHGFPAEWMVAAMHGVAAGDAAQGVVWAAHAAEEAERASGREAGREAVRRVVAAAPGPERPKLERSLARILEGSWTARRWLDERSGATRRRRWAIVGGGGAVLALSAAGAMLLTPTLGSRTRALPLGGANIAIGWGMPGHPDSVRALTVDASFVGRAAPLTSLPAGTRQALYPNMVRPDLKAAAVTCYLPDVDPTAVCLRDIASGTTTTLVRFDGDAAPVGWLPDGSALIVLRARITRAGGYAHELLLVDSSGRVVRTISRDSAAYEGAWAAPLGDRILLLRLREQRSEAAVIDLSGRVLAVIDWCDRSTRVTWSPDGQRLACLLEDTHVLRIGEARPQSWPTHVTLPGAVESGPIWSADGRFVAVSVGGRAAGVYVVDREGMMEPRRVASFPMPPRLIGWMAPGGVPPLHKLVVEPDSFTLAVGASRPLQVRGVGPAGERLGPERMHWLSTDTTVARVDEEGVVVADRPGRAAVIAGIGLERVDDTAYVRVDSTPARQVLDEDFEHGLGPERWRAYGTPAPELRSGAGRGRSTGFLSRGTYTHSSGIALRTALSLDRGLTIEYWAAIPITRPLWQSVKVGLYSAPADSFHQRFGPEPASNVAAVSLEAPNPNDARRQMMAVVSDGGPAFKFQALPRRLADGTWHRYRLVVYPSGEVRWFADGAEAMPPAAASIGGRRLWTLVIAGRSVGTLAMVDDVKVWEGVVLDPVQPARPSSRRGSHRRTR